MSLPLPASSEPSLAASLQPRLPRSLQPLCSQASPSLPALEQTCQKILSLTGGSTSADRLSQLISRDPGLTCKVLQVSNSIAYSPQQIITSIPHAVTWLGLDTVRAIVDAAQLVEHLTQWPDRHHLVSGIIARAIAAAVHAIELGMAMEYSSQSQLFSRTLLYSIGDLAIANQDANLYQTLRSLPLTVKHPSDRAAKELGLLGVPKMRLAQALAQLWSLPPDLVELFATAHERTTGRWQTSQQTLKGLVTGCSALINALTGPADPATVETVTRGLLTGSGLPEEQFPNLLARALDRSHQLVRSAGLSLDSWDDAVSPTAPVFIPPQTTRHRPAELISPGPSAIDTDPQHTLQILEEALRASRDLNALLGCFVKSLHRDGGFSRVAFALLHHKNSDQLLGRVILGARDTVPYLSTLSGSLSLDHPFFLRVLKQTDPILVEDFTTPLSEPIDPAFLHVWNPGSAIIAPLHVGTRPIGLVFCDRGPVPQEVGPKDLQTFHLFYKPTMVCMNRLAGLF